MNKNKFQKYLNWVGRFLVLLSLIFVFRKLWEYKTELFEVTSSGSTWIILLLSSLLYGVFKFIHALGWFTLIQSGIKKGKPIKCAEAVIIFGKTHIAKYIPGNIFHYTSRHIFAKEKDLSDSYLIQTTILEIIIVISISIIFSLFSIRESAKVVFEFYPAVASLLSFGIVIAIVAICIVVVWFFKERFLAVWQQIHIGILLKSFGLYLLFYCINILFFFGMIYVVSPNYSLNIDLIRLIIGGYSLGWLLGFLVPGAPGGIGIREAVLMALLAGIMHQALLLVVIILFRIVTVTGDFIHFLYSILLEKVILKKN